MGIFDRFKKQPTNKPVGDSSQTSEQGSRPTPEASLEYHYRMMQDVDHRFRAVVLDIRNMDRVDGRIKQIHQKTARAACKGGLKLNAKSSHKRLHKLFNQFVKRLHLDRREKLESDIRGLMMEGNLPIQWAVDNAIGSVMSAVRMPSETLVARVGANGRFADTRRAYDQINIMENRVIASFCLYQLTMGRLGPDNYDDWGSFGRPYLDSSRGVWKKLVMTEEDLVVRRRMRAPLRVVHVLEGAEDTELAKYKDGVEADQAEGASRDYYMNRKGTVTAVQGDANLDQIADVAYLLDTFFAGAPAPKGLFGYVGDLNRDILEDLKKDYFDELDALQDIAAFVYEQGFRLDLLLRGINPDTFDLSVQFAERRTDTPNQRADLALKHQALGVPPEMVWGSAGLNPSAVKEELEAIKNDINPYPSDHEIGGVKPNVSITPGNRPKGESATDINNG